VVGLLRHTVEDNMQYAVGIRLCWHVLFATQVPISCIPSARYFGKCLWRETGYMKVTVKRRDRDKQWTDNRHSWPCAHLIHRITGVEGLFKIKPPHREDQPFHQLHLSVKRWSLASNWQSVPQETNKEKIQIS